MSIRVTCKHKLLWSHQVNRFFSSFQKSTLNTIKSKLESKLQHNQVELVCKYHIIVRKETCCYSEPTNGGHQDGFTLWELGQGKRRLSLDKSTSGLNSKPCRVTVVGGGSWGTAISKVIASNVIKYPNLFDPEVVLYLRDDNLRLVIEKTRVNIRYLLKIKLPMNIKPVSDLHEAISRSDILIFAIPHEFIKDVCYKINKSSIPTPRPVGISLIKGLHIDANGNLERSSQIISRMLGIPVGVLSGANVALDVAKEEFSEATLSPPSHSTTELDDTLRRLFATSYFKISLCYDKPTVEICGALKNVISCGAGIVDGIGYGVNTKAAAIRAGIRESIRFVAIFHPDYKLSTFFENCGIADAIASSFGGRNRKVIEEFVNSHKSLAVLERELLGGQKLQGPNTGDVVHRLLSRRELLDQFPLFTTIHKICNREEEPKAILRALETSV